MTKLFWLVKSRSALFFFFLISQSIWTIYILGKNMSIFSGFLKKIVLTIVSIMCIAFSDDKAIYSLSIKSENIGKQNEIQL